MLCVKSMLRLQRKLAPVTLALGLVAPAVADEQTAELTLRRPLSAVHRLIVSKPRAGQTLAVQIPNRPTAQRPGRPVFGKPARMNGSLKNDTVSQTAETALSPPAPPPAPESAPAPVTAPEAAAAPAPQSENPSPAPPSGDSAPAAVVAPPAAATPQVPEVQPAQPGTQPPAAGVELPW